MKRRDARYQRVVEFLDVQQEHAVADIQAPPRVEEHVPKEIVAQHQVVLAVLPEPDVAVDQRQALVQFVPPRGRE